MRFLAAMGVPRRAVAWLREQGHDALHLSEAGLQRLPDAEVLAKASAENRILLTFDLDFSEIVALSGGNPASVVVFRLPGRAACCRGRDEPRALIRPSIASRGLCR